MEIEWPAVDCDEGSQPQVSRAITDSTVDLWRRPRVCWILHIRHAHHSTLPPSTSKYPPGIHGSCCRLRRSAHILLLCKWHDAPKEMCVHSTDGAPPQACCYVAWHSASQHRQTQRNQYCYKKHVAIAEDADWVQQMLQKPNPMGVEETKMPCLHAQQGMPHKLVHPGIDAGHVHECIVC